MFSQAVELLLRGVPSVILFDWEGKGGIFPNHYALVVGYDRVAGRRQLVLNPGWGYDFQLLDMTDPSVAPVTLYWIEGIRDPPTGGRAARAPGRPPPGCGRRTKREIAGSAPYFGSTSTPGARSAGPRPPASSPSCRGRVTSSSPFGTPPSPWPRPGGPLE